MDRAAAVSPYVEGGPLRSDSCMYVIRQHEGEFARALAAEKVVYILAPRQSGKTSLLYWMRDRLREQGEDCVMIDFSMIGLSSSSKTCFYTMSYCVTSSLLPDFDLQSWWDGESSVTLAIRFQRILQLAIERTGRNLSVFVDEFDVLALREDLSELFVAIRSVANEQREGPPGPRIRFAMAGTYPPNRLIRNPAMTPFNSRELIPLRDFTLEQAGIFTKAWRGQCARNAGVVLESIFRRTEGHPYLTHCMCAEVARHGTAALGMPDAKNGYLGESLESVERQLTAISKAIPFYRRMQIHSLYRRCHAQGAVDVDLRGHWADSVDQSLFEELRIAGIVKEKSTGRVMVRNELYKQSFPPPRVGDMLDLAVNPRRWWQWTIGRFASRPERGAITVLGLAFVVSVVLGVGIYSWAIENAVRLERQERKETTATMNNFAANWLYDTIDPTPYSKSLPAINGEGTMRVAEIVTVLHSLVMNPPFKHAFTGVASVHFLPGGRYAATWSPSSSAMRVHDLCGRGEAREISIVAGHAIVTSGTGDGVQEYPVLDARGDSIAVSAPGGVLVGRLPDLDGPVVEASEPPVHLAFSPDGRLLVGVLNDGRLAGWVRSSRDDWRAVDAPKLEGLSSAVFDHEGRTLIVGGHDGVWVSALESGAWTFDFEQLPVDCVQLTGGFNGLGLSHPQEDRLAAASEAGGVVHWDMNDPNEHRCLVTTGASPVRSVALYANGGHLGGNTADGDFYFWNTEDGSVDITIPFGKKEVFALSESGFTRDAEFFYWIEKGSAGGGGLTRFYPTRILDLQKLACVYVSWGEEVSGESYSGELEKACAPIVEEVCGL